MDDTQDLHHQDQLDQQEQEENDGSTSVYVTNQEIHRFHIHCWGSDGTVFLSTNSGGHNATLYLDADNARIMAAALLKAAEAA